jgi:hypothetical protein
VSSSGILLQVIGRLTANHIANRGLLYKAGSFWNPERSEGTL